MRATIMPTPSILMKVMLDRENRPITMISSSAALVMTPPVRCSPLAIAVVEEQAQTLQRTAFSTIVRESGDLAAGVFDAQGRMLAQAVTGTPGHINSMALAVGHVIDHYPIPTMQPADV